MGLDDPRYLGLEWLAEITSVPDDHEQAAGPQQAGDLGECRLPREPVERLSDSHYVGRAAREIGRLS